MNNLYQERSVSKGEKIYTDCENLTINVNLDVHFAGNINVSLSEWERERKRNENGKNNQMILEILLRYGETEKVSECNNFAVLHGEHINEFITM